MLHLTGTAKRLAFATEEIRADVERYGHPYEQEKSYLKDIVEITEEENIVKALSESLTHEDIAELLSFYRSNTGKKIKAGSLNVKEKAPEGYLETISSSRRRLCKQIYLEMSMMWCEALTFIRLTLQASQVNGSVPTSMMEVQQTMSLIEAQFFAKKKAEQGLDLSEAFYRYRQLSESDLVSFLAFLQKDALKRLRCKIATKASDYLVKRLDTVQQAIFQDKKIITVLN